MHVEVSLNVSYSSTDWCNIVGEASDMKSMGGLLVWNMIRYKREAGGEAMNTDTTIAKNIRWLMRKPAMMRPVNGCFRKGLF